MITVVSAVWCPSCLVLKKHIKKLTKEFNLEINYLDYDLDEEEVKKLEVGNVLPVMIYDSENTNKRLIGEKSYEEIVSFLKECGVL